MKVIFDPLYCTITAIALFSLVGFMCDGDFESLVPWAEAPYPRRIQHGFREPVDGTFDPEIPLAIKRRLERLGFVRSTATPASQSTPDSDFKWRFVRTQEQIHTHLDLSWRHQMNWIEGESRTSLKGKKGDKLLGDQSRVLQDQITSIIDNLTDGGKSRRLHAGLEVEE